jgi:uncharacterized alpha-E superfamily protein
MIGDTPLLSRVADSVYWMARYMERAENVARFIGVNLNLQFDLQLDPEHQWQPLIDTSGDTAVFKERYGFASQHNVIDFLTYDVENPNSIYSCLRAARENARSVRETISSEMWEQVNSMYLRIQANRQMPEPESLPEVFRSIRLGSHLFQGITDATMTHSEAWHFAAAGAQAGARRQDLAHPRCQILHAAAVAQRYWDALRRYSMVRRIEVGERI